MAGPAARGQGGECRPMIVKRAALPVAFLLLGVSGGLHGAVAQQAAEPGSWVLSETRSPVDYSPQIAAATTSRTPVAGLAPVLGVHCRRGRTEITLTTGIVPRRMP